MGEIIHVNEEEVKSQLSEMVRETVEKTLNQLLDSFTQTAQILQKAKKARTGAITGSSKGRKCPSYGRKD